MTGFTDVFGGSPVQPSDVAYLALSLAASASLDWPVARILDVTPTGAGFSLAMPSAAEASVGQDALVRNVGSYAFVLTTSTGATILQVDPGKAFFVWIKDNSTASGTWGSIQFGTGTSAPDAAALAGNGLTAVAAALNAAHKVSLLVADYTVQASDRARALVWSSGAGTLALLPVATAIDGYFLLASNQGTGALVLDPSGSEQIDGSTTVSLNPGEACIVVCSGSAWYTIGRGRAATFAVTMLTKSVGGSSDVTLTTTEAGNIVHVYTGTLTGNIAVIVPSAVQLYFVNNSTSGSFTLTVKTAAGTGTVVPQGKRSILHCDGTDVVLSDDAAGGGGSPFSPGAPTAPAIAFVGRLSDGIYSPAAGEVGIATSGVARLIVSDTSASFAGDLSVAGDATVSGNLVVTGTITGIPAPALSQICAFAVALQ